MPQCIHLIPSDGIGGVESAVRTFICSDYIDGHVSLGIMYIANSPDLDNIPDAAQGKMIGSCFASVNNPLAYLAALVKLIRRKPDILICSLWRTMLIGVCYKLLFPKVKLVCFLHNITWLHVLDRILIDLAMLLSSAIWADSAKTLECRVPEPLKPRKRLRPISFVLESHDQGALPKNSPTFVFWGRQHRQKGLDRALQVIAALAKRNPEVKYLIYGPDAGEAGTLTSLSAQLGLSAKVKFMGVTSFEELKAKAGEFSYYLQLSRYEGMAISVVEAMQLGLVPVVCPVGEIANYCNGDNSVLVAEPDDVERYAAVISELLADDQRYQRLQKNCVATWTNRDTYCADIITALHELEATPSLCIGKQPREGEQ